MRKKIALILSKKTYEKKGIWHTSQKYTISSTFSEEFSRCTIKGYEEKNTSYPFFYSRELNISWPLREFCVSVFRQNQEYHVINVHDEGLFPLVTFLPEGWDGMRAGTA